MKSNAQRKAVTAHRNRLANRGLTRLEVVAQEGDREIIREIAAILRGSSLKAGELRKELTRWVAPKSSLGRKELLASAPFEDIDLTRSDDRGRPVDL